MMILIIVLMLVTTNAYGQNSSAYNEVQQLYKDAGYVEPKKATTKPVQKKHHYKRVSAKELNKEAWKFVRLQEKETSFELNNMNYLPDDLIDKKANEDCLDLLEIAIQQSYEGCLLTAKMVPVIYEITGTEHDRIVQTKEHEKQQRALKTHICKNQMLGAKYHHQNTICRIKHDEQWYKDVQELIDSKIYKYTNLYITKQSIAWRGLPYPDNKTKCQQELDSPDSVYYKYRMNWDCRNPAHNQPTKMFDVFYYLHPIHLAGNIRNYAYDSSKKFAEIFYEKELQKELHGAE